MRARHLAAILLALLLGVGVAACGGTQVTEDQPSDLPAITVSEADARGLEGEDPPADDDDDEDADTATTPATPSDQSAGTGATGGGATGGATRRTGGTCVPVACTSKPRSIQ